jgi:hypothetical protein
MRVGLSRRTLNFFLLIMYRPRIVKPRQALSGALAAVLIGVALLGCGDSAEGESADTQAYVEVLHGLARAAKAEASYDAVNHARDLEPAHEATIFGFCRAIREMVLSDENPKGITYPAINTRISVNGQMELREMKLGVDPAGVNAAMGELRKAIDYSLLTDELNRGYVSACYR